MPRVPFFVGEIDDEQWELAVKWGRDAQEVKVGVSRRDADYGWSAPLTRSEVNDLIRLLRRARDQAFGRDE